MLAPPKSAKDGLLPPLLVALTMVTGLVDSFSYLVLGHVIVANMTGNLVFLAFALAGTGGFSAPRSLVAIGAFGLGALAAGGLGRAGSRLADRRELLLGLTAVLQVVLLVAAVIMVALTAQPMTDGRRYSLIVLLAASMGAQNATARKLAIPDLTTTVLTLTITGIAADSSIVGGTGAKAPRRLIPVAALLVGGLIGALIVRHAPVVYPLVIALVVLATVAATGCLLRSSALDLRPERALWPAAKQVCGANRSYLPDLLPGRAEHPPVRRGPPLSRGERVCRSHIGIAAARRAVDPRRPVRGARAPDERGRVA
jgi:uncharacterized membrane protein YoaK (UPF0700 family)